MGGEHPAVAEWIGHRSHPIAPELILDRHRLRGTGVKGPPKCGIDIRQIDHQARRRAATGFRPELAPGGPFIRQNDDGIADLYFGVPDLTAHVPAEIGRASCRERVWQYV